MTVFVVVNAYCDLDLDLTMPKIEFQTCLSVFDTQQYSNFRQLDQLFFIVQKTYAHTHTHTLIFLCPFLFLMFAVLVFFLLCN